MNFIYFINVMKLIADSFGLTIKGMDFDNQIVFLEGTKENKRKCIERMITTFEEYSDIVFMNMVNLLAEIHNCEVSVVDLENHILDFKGTNVEDEVALSLELEETFREYLV